MGGRSRVWELLEMGDDSWLREFFEEGIREEAEKARRYEMQMDAGEGMVSEAETEGEEMDLEEARVRKRSEVRMNAEEPVEARARKRSDVQMDAGEAMRKTQMDVEEAKRKEAVEVMKERCPDEELAVREMNSKAEKAPPTSSRVCKDKEAADLAAYFAASAKERETEPEESRSDYTAYQARLQREFWIDCFSGRYGSYEDATSIPPMRFTDHGCNRAGTEETLQIFSVKIAGIKEGLQWPLDVYGLVALRDGVDHNRNIIFDRKRDNCQTITQEDPYLALTGPTRAVVLSVYPSFFEAVLKVRANTESDDKDFSFLASPYRICGPSRSFVIKRDVTSRLSTLELTVGHIIYSVEATISVEVIRGKWPCGFRGVFTASTASVDDMEVLLLAFGDDKLPVEDDGKSIKLSRRVVSVEILQPLGKLTVSVQALGGGCEEKDVLRDDQVFTPKEAGRSQEMLKVGSCEMVVTVAWSLMVSFE